MNTVPATIDGSLEGIVAARTAIAHIDGRQGTALVRGYLLPDLAAQCSYEEVAHLVLHGELPRTDAERHRLRRVQHEAATLEAQEIRIASLLATGRSKADALAAAIVLAEDSCALEITDPIARAERVLVRVPSVCAAVTGVEVPPTDWPYAQRALAALGGKRFDPPAIRAFEVLLSLESEHGLSASTFACRVAASSGANAGVALAAAVATLSGPRHGGATAEARRLLEEAASASDLETFVRDKYARKERLPGFGHRIYKVPDPRVPPLRQAMRAMGNVRLLPVAEALERYAAPLYGPKGVYPNIDLFGAVLLDALGIESEQFVAAFALGVACGWLAHWNEQRTSGRLIRPDSEYIGPPLRQVPR